MGNGWPVGRVTVVFTDIEGSTALLRDLGEGYDALLSDHFDILRDALAAHGGAEINTEGDAVLAAFAEPRDALAACIEAQRALGAHVWPPGAPVRVRMALHTGDVRLARGEYVGLAIHQAARIIAAVHGGQIVCSDATAAAAQADTDAFTFEDLGRWRLRDFDPPPRLLQVVAPGLDSAFPALRAVSDEAHNLPAARTPLIGRDRELDLVAKLLPENRLVTITGPGGVGKTRVSFEVARRLAPGTADGVVAVLLAPVEHADLVAAHVATAIGVREEPGRSLVETVAAAVARKDMVLVLDNCEHVIAAAAELVDAILERDGKARVLATSRRPLGIAGEQVYPLPTFDRADPEHPPDRLVANDAVRLFVERARAADPHFAPTAEDLSTVARITGELDGLPLAIELAAARLRTLSLGELRARLHDRLHLLADTGARRGRHESLRATINWSFELLSARPRQVFARLAVFPDGATVEALATVCDATEREVIDAVTELVDESLARMDRAGTTRFTMLEAVREFGIERLRNESEEASTLDRLSTWATEVARRAAGEMRGREAQAAIATLDADHENLLAGLAWLTASGAGEQAADLAGLLCRYWDVTGRWTLASERLEALPEPVAEGSRAELLRWRGHFALLRNDFDAAGPLFDAAADLASKSGRRDVEARARAENARRLAMYGDAAGADAERERAVAAAKAAGDPLVEAEARSFSLGGFHTSSEPSPTTIPRALAQARETGDLAAEASVLEWEVCIAAPQDRHRDALDHLYRLLDLSRVLGDRRLEGDTLFLLAHEHRLLREVGAAEERCRDGLDLARQLGHRQLEASCAGKLGNIAYAAGDYATATAHLVGALALAREVGDRTLEEKTLSDLGSTAGASGDFGQAATWHETGVGLAREMRRLDAEVGWLRWLAAAHAGAGAYDAAQSAAEHALAIVRNNCPELDRFEPGIVLAAAQIDVAAGRHADGRHRLTLLFTDPGDLQLSRVTQAMAWVGQRQPAEAAHLLLAAFTPPGRGACAPVRPSPPHVVNALAAFLAVLTAAAILAEEEPGAAMPLLDALADVQEAVEAPIWSLPASVHAEMARLRRLTGARTPTGHHGTDRADLGVLLVPALGRALERLASMFPTP